MTATSGDGANQVTFGIGPARAGGALERPFFNYGVTPGAGASDAAEVFNLSYTLPVTVTVYPVDVVNNSDGTQSFPAAGIKPVSTGSWIAVHVPGGGQSVTVPPRQSVVVPVNFAVPFKAAPGDHVGAIIASLSAFIRNGSGQNIRFDQRVATRVFFRVSGPLRPKLAIENLRATYQQNYNPAGPGTVTVRYTVHNVGNAKLAVHQAVTFKGLLGNQVVAHGVPTIAALFPDGTDVMTVRLKGVYPEIIGSARVTLTPRPVASDIDPGLQVVSASTSVWTLPLVIIAILILLALGWWYRQRRKNRPASGRTGVTAPSATASGVATPGSAGVKSPGGVST